MIHNRIHSSLACGLALAIIAGCASQPSAKTAMPAPFANAIVIDDVRMSAIAVHLPDQNAVDVRIAVDRTSEPAGRIAAPRVLAPLDEPARVVIAGGGESIVINIESAMRDGRVIVNIEARIKDGVKQAIHPSLRIPALTAQKNATTPN